MIYVLLESVAGYGLLHLFIECPLDLSHCRFHALHATNNGKLLDVTPARPGDQIGQEIDGIQLGR